MTSLRSYWVCVSRVLPGVIPYLSFSRILLIGFLLATSGAIAGSSSKVTIAIIDTCLDYDNLGLSEFIDHEILGSLTFVDVNGNQHTLREVNQQSRQELEKLFTSAQYRDAAAFLSAYNRLQDYSLTTDKQKVLKQVVLKGILKARFLPGFKERVDAISLYMHGTHVAGILVNQLGGDVRLINFPIKNQKMDQALERAFFSDPEKARGIIRNYFDQISSILSQSNVRVMNLGMEGSAKNIEKRAKKPSWLDKFINIKSNSEISLDTTQVWREEITRFINANPKTIFVAPVGNDSLRVDATAIIHTATIEAPNLIKVGAVDAAGKFAEFSNYSERFVDVAAPGVAIKGLQIGGGEIYGSGTSQASPAVGNAIIKIITAHPEWSVDQVLQTFNTKLVEKKDALTAKTKEGSVLRNYLEIQECILRLRNL